MTTFSLLPTASLLCAFENEGYGKLVLLPSGEFDSVLLSTSGIGTDDRRLVVGESVVELRSSVGDVLSTSLRDERIDLWRGLSLDLGESASRSFSLSRIFEGIVDANCGEGRRRDRAG